MRVVVAFPANQDESVYVRVDQPLRCYGKISKRTRTCEEGAVEKTEETSRFPTESVPSLQKDRP